MQIENAPFGRHARPANTNGQAPASRRWRYVIAVLALGMSMLAAAVEMDSLYTVEVALDPRDPDAQEIAFRTALAEVLVRVKGTTAIVEAEQMATLFPNPGRFVSQYRPGPDNTLLVSLDGPAIEAVLRQSGAAIWGDERPLTLIWIAIDRGLGEREIVAAELEDRLPRDARIIDQNRPLRERIKTIASYRGIPISFPLLDTEDLESISFSDIWGGFDDLLLQASMRYGAESVLVGRIRQESLQEDRWTWYHNGQRTSWLGDVGVVVNLLADSLAAEYALTGREPVSDIRLTISGVNSVSAFGEVQRVMENLRGVDTVMIQTVAGDRIVYEVRVQGGSERLEKSLESSNLLERVSVIDATDGSVRGEPGDRQTGSLEFIYRSD